MDYLSSPSNKTVDNIRYSEESNFKTPKDKRIPSHLSPSPDFAPFNFSSPVKSDRRMSSYHGGRNKRYFNVSDSGSSHCGNFNSPFNKHRRVGGRNNFGRGGYRNNRYSSDVPISAYVDASMTEDPWLDLERELMRSRQDRASTKASFDSSDSQEKEDDQIR